MIALLIRLFIPRYKETDKPEIRQKYGLLLSVMGIFFNLILFFLKFLAGTLSGAVSIRTDAFNNLSDAGSSLMTLFGIKLSAKKPDPDHPFGHGRLEYITAFVVSAIILVMGLELAEESVLKLISPTPLDHTWFWLSTVILSASVLVKIYMFLYNRKYGRKTASPVMLATAADSASDAIATFAVLVTSVITFLTDWQYLDGATGLVVSILIFHAGIRAVKDTLLPLLGKPPEPELIEEIRRIVLEFDPIIDIHDLVVHDYGPGRMMISLHAEVPADGSILEIHDVIDNAENALKEKLHCEAVIHSDPVDTSNPETLALKADLAGIIKDVSPRLSMHDFRVVYGATHTNLIFDLVIPYEFDLAEKDLLSLIGERVQKKHPRHNCVIQVDHEYARRNK